MSTDKEIVEQFLNTLASEVKNKISPMSASGKTADSIEVVMDEYGGSILAAKYISVLEDGRPPTRAGAVKGDPTMQQSIYAWIKYIGLGSTPKNQESLSWAISNYIHKNGNKLWRAGGKSGVLSNVFTDKRINSFAKIFAAKYETLISSEIIEKYK